MFLYDWLVDSAGSSGKGRDYDEAEKRFGLSPLRDFVYICNLYCMKEWWMLIDQIVFLIDSGELYFLVLICYDCDSEAKYRIGRNYWS